MKNRQATQWGKNERKISKSLLIRRTKGKILSVSNPKDEEGTIRGGLGARGRGFSGVHNSQAAFPGRLEAHSINAAQGSNCGGISDERISKASEQRKDRERLTHWGPLKPAMFAVAKIGGAKGRADGGGVVGKSL